MFLFRKTFWLVFLSLIVGFAAGAYLFVRSEARPLLNFKQCETLCFQEREVLGILSSVGIQRFGNFVPSVVAETDKSIAIIHPQSEAAAHFVVIPKKDIRNVGEVAQEDEAYLVDAFAVMERIIHEKNMTRYRIITNGPGFQQVGYLHFHLIGGQEPAAEE